MFGGVLGVLGVLGVAAAAAAPALAIRKFIRRRRRNMADKILSIDHGSADFNNQRWIGYTIATDKQTIRVYLEDYQNCCEVYDVILLAPPDMDIMSLKPAVKSVGWGLGIAPQFREQFLDRVRHLEVAQDKEKYAVVNLDTHKAGLLQIVAYNNHNGYYPHSLYVEWHGHAETQEL